MASWSEIEPKYKFGVLSLVCVLIAAGVWYAVVRPMEQTNKRQLGCAASEEGRDRAVDALPGAHRPNEQGNREVSGSRLRNNKQIVPEDKQVDGFIRLIQTQAHSSGIEIRRFTAMPVATHDFYSELPFELELDGPYFSVVRFFEGIGKIERLVSVSGLSMANVKNPGQAKAKKSYRYAPGESVVATCTASAFFSPKTQPAVAKPLAPGKPGKK